MSLYKVQVRLERRDDGGLRAWSDEVPELVLSHPDADAVLADLPAALEVILSGRLGGTVEVTELHLLPSDQGASTRTSAVPQRREFAAQVAA